MKHVTISTRERKQNAFTDHEEGHIKATNRNFTLLTSDFEPPQGAVKK